MTCKCKTYERKVDYNPYGPTVTVYESCRECEPETTEERFTRMSREAEDYIYNYRKEQEYLAKLDDFARREDEYIERMERLRDEQ